MKTVIKIVAICAFVVSTQFSWAQDEEPITIITNVDVYDGFDTFTEDTDVMIQGNHIIEVGSNLRRRGATIIDGGGRTLTPGLIDMHTAVFSEGDCRQSGCALDLSVHAQSTLGA